MRHTMTGQQYKSRTISGRKNSAGFTLIEILFVMLISGIILLTLITGYDRYIQKRQIVETQDDIRDSVSQMAYFFSGTKRYPCPSDRGVGVNEDGFGKEAYIDAGFSDCIDYANSLGGPPNCSASGGFCVVESVRDADGNGVNDWIVIGGVPTFSLFDQIELPISKDIAVDAWDNQLTYAVSLNLTDDVEYKFDRGVITAEDEFGNDTAGMEDDAHYVVISHGKNGRGAFNSSGAQQIPCGDDAVDGPENDNCDLDPVFKQALGYYEGDAASFHDDYLYFTKSQGAAIWSHIPMTTHIYNLNTRNVGINTDVPVAKLEVSGNLRTDRAARAKYVCDAAGENCFDPAEIEGVGFIECPPGQVITGIETEDLMGEGIEPICEEPEFQGLDTYTCPEGEWLQGIKTNGAVCCTDDCCSDGTGCP